MAISKTEYDKYLKEILTFADDYNNVIKEMDGTICFTRLNQLMAIKLLKKNDNILVEYNGSTMPYKTFLAKHLACLDLMARRIKEKDPSIQEQYYVDGMAKLWTDEGTRQGSSIELLDHECKREVFIGSKICFVTANAGHGKTVLLRQYQFKQATEYLQGKTDFLFVHIDLHGHDLRKLDAVIMYEMAGVLRMPGIYTNSIITLMRNGLLILGVDGFDELAVETGGEKAIGSFSNLVRDLDSQGVLIAASRRTFFSAQDYVKRKGYLDDVNNACFCFDELRLENWGKSQCSEYMEWALPNMNKSKADTEYDKVLSYLSPNTNNPLVERPFLFTNIVECANKDGKSVYEYLREGGDSEQGIERIINSFINREVDKWNSNNITNKQEYLTFKQHKQLLAAVAEEMWLSQREYISYEMLEVSLTVLMEEWNILPNLQPDIIKMSKSHAFLVQDEQGNNMRRFDHVEFRNYFLAKSIEEKILFSLKSGNFSLLKRMLSIGQLPDAVAMYLSQSNEEYDRVLVVKKLMEEVKNEYRTTFFHTNLGTLLPFLLDDMEIDGNLEVAPKLVFSSLVFENKTLKNITFNECFFVNVSFIRTHFNNVHFKKCEFTDIRLHQDRDCKFDNVTYDEGTKIHRVSEYTKENELISSEFNPLFVRYLLYTYGIMSDSFMQMNQTIERPKQNTHYRKAVMRFLNKYNTSSLQYEINLKEDPIYNSSDYDLYMDDIIPLMLKYHIIKETKTNNSRQLGSRAWALDNYELRYIFDSENDIFSPLHEFWDEVNDK